MSNLEKLAYVSGISDTPLLYETIGNALTRTTEQWGEREALVVKHQNIRWNYTELNRRSEAIAAGLLALDLEPGDRVGVWSPNCVEWVLAQFATAKAGIIQVNINPAYRTQELEYVLKSVGCKALICADQFKTSNYINMIEQLIPALKSSVPGKLDSRELPDLRAVIRLGQEKTPGLLNFDDLYALGGDEQARRLQQLSDQLQPDDPINIQFTSGTTGSPKGSTLTHFNILNNGYFVGEAMQFTERDRLCIPVPLYHCFGMTMGNLNCITHGAAMVIPNSGFDPELTLQAIAEEKCTALFGVPTMFIAELDHENFGRYDLSSLRTRCMAGAPCPKEVMKKIMSQMHMSEVTIAYGMTETSPVSFQSSTDDPIDLRVSTVGRIHPHLEVKLVDEQGRTVKVGEKGELCTRGYSVMLGYWNEEQKTREVIDRNGWMHTGDLATIDEAGYCRIVGRAKDMVIRGGENIYPREVEEFLYTHEKIQDVSVFGVPDEKYGEQLCAWITLKAGEDCTEQDIKQYCKNKISHQKMPHYVRFVDVFPMTVTGKIQKFVMRDEMIEALGLQHLR